jgi:hypothetical protein
MPKKRFSAEQIVMLPRQIEVSLAQGKSTPVACRDAGISQHYGRSATNSLGSSNIFMGNSRI